MPGWTLDQLQPWRPGDYGKGLVLTDGSLHLWRVECGADGRPQHATVGAALGCGVNAAPVALWVEPNGAVTASGNPPVTNLEELLAGYHDALHPVDSDWRSMFEP